VVISIIALLMGILLPVLGERTRSVIAHASAGYFARSSFAPSARPV